MLHIVCTYIHIHIRPRVSESVALCANKCFATVGVHCLTQNEAWNKKSAGFTARFFVNHSMRDTLRLVSSVVERPQTLHTTMVSWGQRWQIWCCILLQSLCWSCAWNHCNELLNRGCANKESSLKELYSNNYENIGNSSWSRRICDWLRQICIGSASSDLPIAVYCIGSTSSD